MKRRNLLIYGGIAAASGYATTKLTTVRETPLDAGPAGNSSVAILRAKSYSEDLLSKLREGVRGCGLDVRGKKVLLKPNMVEFDRATAINTDVAVLAAALDLFREMGASSVRIAEGPGHRRDTIGVLARLPDQDQVEGGG